jgi:hypothetical protein
MQIRMSQKLYNKKAGRPESPAFNTLIVILKLCFAAAG